MITLLKNKRKHLEKEERFLIEKMLRINKSFGYIAKLLDRGISTVSEEVSRNGGREGYKSNLAQIKAKERQANKKLELNKVMRSERIRKQVDLLLSSGKSPEFISLSLRKKSKMMYVSPKSIRKYLKLILQISK